MSWITPGMLLAGAAVGALLALAFTRGRSRPVRVGSLVAAALAVAVLAHFLVTPPVRDALAGSRAERELLATPIYRVLRQHEPEVFERLRGEYARVVGGAADDAEFVLYANKDISRVATQRLAHASDAAVLGLMRDLQRRLDVLRRAPGDDCYRYLFPDVAGSADLRKHFKLADQERTFDLMAEVIRTAAESPAPLPPPERVQALMGPVIDGVYSEFGDDTRVMQRAEEPDVDRRKVCDVVASLYRRVLELPPADAAAVMRSMTQL